MATSYTMREIKEIVVSLQDKAISQHKLDCINEFSRVVEENPELEMDFKAFADCVQKATELAKKYENKDNAGRWFCHKVSANRLREYVQDSYLYSKNDRQDKIYDQFRIIGNKLKTIRNPEKAIEFLKLCGIELPEPVIQMKPDAPIDVDFIKMILPKNVLISEGKESEVVR